MLAGMAMLAAPANCVAANVASAAVCKSGAVEMIVGGKTSGQCDTAPDGRSQRVLARPETNHLIPRDQQLARDQDRKRILKSELERELAGLARLQRSSGPQDHPAIVRIQDNIAALNRELALVASQQARR
jgi:hypothetical protein